MRKHPSLSMIAFVAAAPTLLSGCHGIIWGNLAMLALAVGIFMGTLSLGRD